MIYTRNKSFSFANIYKMYFRKKHPYYKCSQKFLKGADFFMNFKNKLRIFFAFLLFILPLNVLAYSEYIIPGGKTVGIEVNSKGVLVVGFYKVDNIYIGRDAGFEVGDKIMKVDAKEVNNIDEMIRAIEANESKKVKFMIDRDHSSKQIELTLTQDEAGVYKTGLYVKDQITGIGTLTYIDPGTKKFGALGHEIMEKTTAQKFEIKDGTIFNANVTGITKSEKNKAGEKNATYRKSEVYGTIEDNEISGIFGNYTEAFPDDAKLKVASPLEVHTGDATIRTVVEGEKIEEYHIDILKLDDSSKTKNILFEITDSNLLNKTGGVVQGMSGSPIIQDEKIVGAVTHVIVNDSTKGYGIFITTMLKEGEN